MYSKELSQLDGSFEQPAKLVNIEKKVFTVLSSKVLLIRTFGYLNIIFNLKSRNNRPDKTA